MTWEEVYSVAEELGAKFPEVVAAQWALESAWGTHTSGVHNYYGIKGVPGTVKTTQEFVNGKWIVIKDSFKNYASLRDCTKDLINKWYKDYAGYSGVNRGSSREESARLLVKEGYATDPRYSDKLIKLMNQYQPIVMDNASFLERAAEFYKAELHQKTAWRVLEQSLDSDTLERFKASYRGSQAPLTASTAQPSFPLKVPYFYQRDSKTGHGERMCFSSSMAMALDYLSPSAIAGDDDWYLNQVFRFGDSVSSEAQIKCAHSLGFKASFRTNGSQVDLEKLLDEGVPVPIGILHKGSINSPSGGGHWICLIGYDSANFHVHDPFGELDLVRGGYPKAGPKDGDNCRYSKKNLMKRWLIANSSDGWYVDLRQK